MELKSYIDKLRESDLTQEERLQIVYEDVRDYIQFDFLPEIDDISPEEVFRLRKGQCNNKTVLIHKILTELGFDVTVYFSTIDKNIHRGFFPSLLFFFTPKYIGHSWIVVKLDKREITLDGYINDLELFNSAIELNRRLGWKTGHSVAIGECGTSAEFSLHSENFVQMEAIEKEMARTKAPRNWLQSQENPNQVNLIKRLLYRLFLPIIRKRVQRVRLRNHPSFSNTTSKASTPVSQKR